MRAVLGHGRRLRAILVLLDNRLPGLPLDAVDLLEEVALFCILSLPGVGLDEAKLAHLLVLHQSALHAALQVAHLVVAAPLGEQLMPQDAVGVLLGLLVALVEVVQRKGATVRGLRHYFNYDQKYPTHTTTPPPHRSQRITDPCIIILFSRADVMY